MTRDDIHRKIGQIEQEEDEFYLFARNLRCEEEHEAECVWQNNRSLEHIFEECQGDKELLDVLEHERDILQKIQYIQGDLMCDLDQMQKGVKYKCEQEIDDLRRQLQSMVV